MDDPTSVEVNHFHGKGVNANKSITIAHLCISLDFFDFLGSPIPLTDAKVLAAVCAVCVILFTNQAHTLIWYLTHQH